MNHNAERALIKVPYAVIQIRITPYNIYERVCLNRKTYNIIERPNNWFRFVLPKVFETVKAVNRTKISNLDRDSALIVSKNKRIHYNEGLCLRERY